MDAKTSYNGSIVTTVYPDQSGLVLMALQWLGFR